MIKLVDLTKIYNSGESVGIGISNINLELNVGEFVAIVGASGSGKTTLLNIISGMDTYTEGEMLINGETTSNYDSNQLENYRRANVAFIFQNYNLIDSYTVLENVIVELLLKGYDKKEAKTKAIELLKKVGMQHRLKNRASNLSGGEKQRVVIARALASDANILACDEPTGNLDEKNTKEIMSLIKEVSEDKLVLFVTHDESLIKDNATRVVKIRDGKIESDTKLYEVEHKELIINESKKNSLSTKLYITLKNIFRTPKKTSFVFLVFLIISFIMMFSIAYLPLNIVATSNYPIELEMFSNRNENRIVVYPNEQFDEDLSFVKGQIFKKDFLLDYNFAGNSTHSYLQLHQESKFIFNQDKLTLEYGRFPSEDAINEIVIIHQEKQNENYYQAIIDNNTIVKFRNENSTGDYLSTYYKVVGFASCENLNDEVSYYYLNDKAVDNFYKDLENYIIKRKDSSLFERDFSFLLNNENNLISIDNTVPKDDIYIYFRYRDDDYKLLLGNKTIDLSNYNVQYKYADVTSYYLKMSFETAYQMLSDSNYRFSVISDTSYLQENITNLRNNQNLLVFPMIESKIDIPVYDYTSIFKNLFSLIFVFIEIVVSIFIASLITSFILSTKKKEIGILRVIGLSKTDVLQTLYFEVVTLMIISIALNVIIGLVLLLVNPSFSYTIIFNNPIKLVVSIAILIIMAVFIAYRWNKSMFKLTAREVLKAGE